MKIKKDDRDSIKETLGAWAKKHKAKVRDEGNLTVSKGDWAIEVIPEDGWAYMHGQGSLGGISTNISSMDEFEDAVKRLTGAK